MRPAFILTTIPLIATAKLFRDLSQTDFQRFLRKNPLVLTAFSSPNYQPVQPFISIFEQVAENSQTPSILINCDEQKEVCKEYDINAYPAIRMFGRKGSPGDVETEMTRYRGKRTRKALESFLLKHELPVVMHIEDYRDFVLLDDVVVVAYLHPDQEDQKALLSVFENVAAKYRYEFVFGYTDDVGTLSAEVITTPHVTCWRNIDGDDRHWEGPFTEADLEALLEKAKAGVIGEFSERNMDVYMAKDKLTVYTFTLNPATSNELLHDLTPIAKKYAKYVTFGIAEATEYAPMAQNFGLEVEKGFPALVVHAPVNDNVFVYRQGRVIRQDLVEGMLTAILQGKAEPGQVFGSEAEVVKAGTGTNASGERRDEL